MDITEIINRNYAATCKRGLIKPETTDFEFVEKLKEEVTELEGEVTFPIISYPEIAIEMADCALVLFAMATHFNIDLIKAMEEKVIYNENRKD